MEKLVLKDINIYKITIPKSIIILILFAVALNVLRIVIWGKMSFVYILWNIFLAIIPFIISSALLSFSKEGRFSKIILILGSVLWLLFIPNAPYIVTDLIHLGTSRSIPILYDAILLFSSAYVGLILGFYSLSHMEQIIQMRFSKRKTFVIMTMIILLISFGMYLGRFLRFNSWDIFLNHTSLLKNVWEIFSQAAVHMEVYLYTGLFFLFLGIFYLSWKHQNIK